MVYDITKAMDTNDATLHFQDVATRAFNSPFFYMTSALQTNKNKRYRRTTQYVNTWERGSLHGCGLSAGISSGSPRARHIHDRNSSEKNHKGSEFSLVLGDTVAV